MYTPSAIRTFVSNVITLTPGVLSASIGIGTVSKASSIVTLHSIATTSSGDGTGSSDMGAEGYVELTGSVGSDWTTVTAFRSIDNAGCSTSYFFNVVEWYGGFLRGPIQHNAVAGVGSKAIIFHRGNAEPASVGVLPTVYKGGWQYDCADFR